MVRVKHLENELFYQVRENKSGWSGNFGTNLKSQGI